MTDTRQVILKHKIMKRVMGALEKWMLSYCDAKEGSGFCRLKLRKEALKIMESMGGDMGLTLRKCNLLLYIRVGLTFTTKAITTMKVTPSSREKGTAQIKA